MVLAKSVRVSNVLNVLLIDTYFIDDYFLSCSFTNIFSFPIRILIIGHEIQHFTKYKMKVMIRDSEKYNSLLFYKGTN